MNLKMEANRFGDDWRERAIDNLLTALRRYVTADNKRKAEACRKAIRILVDAE